MSGGDVDGGAAEGREEARKHHTTISFHVNMLDASAQSPLWQTYLDHDVIARNADGSLRTYVLGVPDELHARMGRGPHPAADRPAVRDVPHARDRDDPRRRVPPVHPQPGDRSDQPVSRDHHRPGDRDPEEDHAAVPRPRRRRHVRVRLQLPQGPRHDIDLARRFADLADGLKRYFSEEWSRTADPDALVRAYDTSGRPLTGWGKENSWFMPMKRIVDTGPRNDAYLDFIDARATDPTTAPRNIEAISYLPDTFFANDRAATAWKWMQYVYDQRETRHVNTRQGLNGDYPEIPFTLLSQTVEGLMGVKPDAPNAWIATLSRLPEEIGWLEVADVPFGSSAVTVRHDGTAGSALTNQARDRALVWEARFQGTHTQATVNGAPVPARTQEIDGVTYTVVERPVPPGRQVTIEVSN